MIIDRGTGFQPVVSGKLRQAGSLSHESAYIPGQPQSRCWSAISRRITCW